MAASPGGQPERPGLPTAPMTLAFAVWRETPDRFIEVGIDVIDADGTDRRWLIRRASEPIWSPGGSLIAFNRDYSLWLAKADGTAQRRLVGRDDDTVLLGTVGWSPDGGQIIFQGDRGIYIIDVANGHRSLLISGASPHWSPDGQWISVWREGTLYIVRPDGSDLRKIGPVNDAGEWSPDSERLAYERDVGQIKTHLYVFDLATMTERKLTRKAGFLFDFAWSPDGKRIAYANLLGGINPLYVIPSGGGRARLLAKRSCEPDLTWSPDGRWITCLAPSGILLIRSTGTQTRRVTTVRDPLSHSELSWVPSPS